ncbi:putative sugar nucleotidyl transferase [Candidatus Neomarinimicrobiota bacterium]
MIYIFEDSHALDLEPVALTRATFELRCGALTHLERIKRTIDSISNALIVRPELAQLMQERYPDSQVNPVDFAAGIWINGAALWDESSVIALQEPGACMAYQGRLVGANLSASEGQELAAAIWTDTQPSYSSNVSATAKLLPHLWDHCHHNADQLDHDYNVFFKGSAATVMPAGIQAIGDGGVFLGKNDSIDPFVLLDTRHGPIIIDSNVHIGSHTVIEGPAYIGPDCDIWPQSTIKNVSFGPACRLMGQVSGTILQGFTNKQHYGFLGDAYLGSWVNLGAGTTNSNLKSNYGKVSVMVNESSVNTGSLFVGLFMGDYSKSAIGTLFPTGSTVGIGANIFGTLIPDKVIPPFTWGNTGEIYDLEKFLATAVIVKERRDQQLSQAERDVLTALHPSTS